MRYLLIVLLLAGCANREPKIITKTVEVPVAVPCVKQEQIPAERKLESDSLVKEDSIFNKAQSLLIDVKGLDSDNGVMRAALKACVKD